MTAPSALQLYTVREALNKDYPGTLRRVAEMGYIGIETTQILGTPAEVAASQARELGLEICSAHVPLPIGNQKNEALDEVAAWGCDTLISGAPKDLFSSLDGLHRLADMLNEAEETCQAHGLRYGYHNHYWEFQALGEQRAFEILFELVSPGVFFQIDTYWAQVAGVDVPKLLSELGKRAPLLHIKDGPGLIGQPMVAVGQGAMDFPAIISASQENVEWLIVELDNCATDIVKAAADSYQYLVDYGLARGRK